MLGIKEKNAVVEPYFPGEPNVILIQLFAIDSKYEMRSFDFVFNIFEVFPTKDYILITIPHLVPEFPLLEHFVRITPRPGVILPHELYALHKGSLIQNFIVRAACSSDKESVTTLIENLSLSHHILDNLEQFILARRSDDGVNLYAFVAECIGKIVGIAILQDEENIEYIRSHYNIEDFIYFNHYTRNEHAHIKHFALNPVFKKLAKAFIKEVMRMTKKSSFYFPVYKPWASIKNLKAHSLPTIIPELVAIRPRRQIVYDLKKLGKNAPTERVLQVLEGYCLLHINKKLVMESKLAINLRIVVIGASTVGLSFLEALAFCPHLKFNNLFLVSPHGLPDNYDDNALIEQLIGKNFHFSKMKLELSALRIHVTVVKGTMTAIDRKKKLITINKKFLLPYDHMIISTGLQYTIPCPTHISESLPNKNFPIKTQPSNTPNRRYSELFFKNHINKSITITKKIPQNLLTINDPFDANECLQFVQRHMLNDESRIIIYGNSFESFCSLHTLLSMGILGYRIYFIKPPYDKDNYSFNNKVIDELVYKTLSDSGVIIHENYSLFQYNYSDDIPSWITSATFSNDGHFLHLDCKMFISYYQRVVNYDAFRAINDSCLVFDARLVIDTFFHTNDVSIRAAGPVTKFKRRYYSDQWNHSKFASQVVGEELSKTFLQIFDPTLKTTTIPPTEKAPLIPFYNDSICKSCILPGGYHYLNVNKPTLERSSDAIIDDLNYAFVLCTGEPRSDQGYFILHLDQYRKVTSITCLRKREFPTENYIQLYGIHERALNNLYSRYKEGLVKDLFEFFDDDWAIALYHDRFKYLEDELVELLLSKSVESICKISVEETIRRLMSTDTELNMNQKKEVLNEYRNSGTMASVDKGLINFIAYNYYHLPMYAKPDMI